MAHEIEILENNEASFAFTGERNAIWHGLGKQIPNDLTPEQIMDAANLNWTVKRRPNYIHYGGKFVPTESESLVRESDGRILDGKVTKTWNPVQNAQAAEFFHDFVMSGNLDMDTAGSLHDGRMVFFLAKFKEPMMIAGKDVTKPYLLFTNPHQFGKSLNIKEVYERTVCANTLAIGLAEVSGTTFRMNHQRKFNVEEAKKLVNLSMKHQHDYVEKCEFLTKFEYTDDTAKEFLEKIFPRVTDTKGKGEPSRNATRAFEILETQPGADIAPNSLYQLFNVVTYMADHELGRNDDTRMQSAIYGVNANKKEQALKLALQMAEAA